METAVLGLEQYKTAPVEASANELTRINKELEELAQDCFPVEKEAKTQLLHQKALYTYPKLDTSFLSLCAEREWKYEYGGNDKSCNIKVPRFSVHRLDEPEMVMVIESDGYRSRVDIDSPDGLPSIIAIPLLKSTELFYGDNSINFDRRRIFIEKSFFNPKELKKILNKWGEIGDIEIRRSFSGLIPQKNKRIIREAQKTFEGEIFLFAEAKPEDWNVRKYIADPIVAGVIKGDCFYIDKFNTTPLEEFVKTGFSQTN